MNRSPKRANSDGRAAVAAECCYLSVLTSREREVYECLQLGYSQGEIARALCISVHTARWHARRVRSKLVAPSGGEGPLRGPGLAGMPPTRGDSHESKE
jgi:DNA-binding NarL/FixJ family response regulator